MPVRIEKYHEEGIVPDLCIEVSKKSAEKLLDVLEDWLRLTSGKNYVLVKNFDAKKGWIFGILDPMGKGHLVREG